MNEQNTLTRTDAADAPPGLRIGFAGSHTLSWFCLKTIAELCRAYGDTIEVVLNIPPEQGARHSAFVEFDTLEKEYSFPHCKVKDLTDPETLNLLRARKLDVLFIIGWHRIVPQEVINSATYCLGMHTSLLPADRGSSPANWALIRGDRFGGMSYFHLTIGVDSGDLVAQRRFRIGPRDTCRDVHEKATVAALRMLRAEWPRLRRRQPPRQPQDESRATLNPRRRAADGLIDWSKTSLEIDRWVRALARPYPGAFSFYRGRKLFVWEVRPVPKGGGGPPGFVLRAGKTLRVATGEGAVDILRLQYEGEPECSAEIFACVHAITVGAVLP